MIRDFHQPGRSPAFACEGMAATSHPLATLVAVETLRAGGTAADAAIAAVATLCVVEPAMTGIGGDCFALIAKPDKPVWGYNGSGRSAATASAEALLAQGVNSISQDSIHSVTVPGAVEAWEAILKAHGRFSLERALQPAVHYAEQGFVIAPRVGYDWAEQEKRLARDPGAAKHFLVDGRAPKVGEVMRMPALAETLKLIAKHGPKAFYEGPVAEDIAKTVSDRGSFIRADDLARHTGDDAAPISTDYRGIELVELPPNGQGITALVLLNILESFDLKGLDPLGPERFHLALEAARIAYAARDTHVADPETMRVAVSALLDKAFARGLAKKIDPSKRAPLPTAPTPGSDTVYLTVVDRDRTAVSLINSLYGPFGVGIATEKTGIMLQNRGACFVVDPKHPNTIGPSKRCMHTIIPALGMRDGRCQLAFGVMGGDYQPMGHVHVIQNIVDFGLDVQAAVDLPRAFYLGETTLVESGVPAETVAGLKARGHKVETRSSPYGGGQMIWIDWERGVLIGGSDPRKDGTALGY